MSFLKQANIGYNKDEFWSGQAVVETKFSVGDLVTARTSKVNMERKPVGGRSASAANTVMQVNYLAVFFKSASISSGKTPPVVFDSLTGWGYDPNKDTKYSMMEKLSLAGRLQSSVNYEGTIPTASSISVQCGGMCAIRLFMKTPQECVSWMDRLCWTIPDIDDSAKAEQQYRHLQGMARQEFPVGKIPILVEKMSEQSYSEFPRVAMTHFCNVISEPNTFEYFMTQAARDSRDPRDIYILSNFLAPVRLQVALGEFTDDGSGAGSRKLKSWQTVLRETEDGRDYAQDLVLGGNLFGSNNAQQKAGSMYTAALMMNVGLVGLARLKEMDRKLAVTSTGLAVFIDRLEKMSPKQKAEILGLADLTMAGQYQSFIHLRDHNFGKALTVGHPGDGIRILFRI
jgi:hypothetical protein